MAEQAGQATEGEQLYFEVWLTPQTVRFILNLLEAHRRYREEGITLLREKWGDQARTGFVEGEMTKAATAIDEIKSWCRLD